MSFFDFSTQSDAVQRGRVLHHLCVLLPIILCLIVPSLTGCGSRKPARSDFSIEEQQSVAEIPVEDEKNRPTESSRYLPPDDFVPLSPAEKMALMNEGETDRNLSDEDMRDVILHFKKLVHKERVTVESAIRRCRPYLTHIRRELKKRGLPEDLIWVAFIESGFNPKCRSYAGAMGVWQFIPSTGRHFGMHQDWYVDERRDPYFSTQAAAEYLAKLYRMFGDWGLAITSYNAGEGRVSRGMAATGAKNFFELRRRNMKIREEKDRLSPENRQYYPKYVAVRKIMNNLEKLGFSPLPQDGSDVAVFQVPPGTNLVALSRALGMNWYEFSENNPHFLRYSSPKSRYARMYVPQKYAAAASSFLKNPRAYSRNIPDVLQTYIVQRGDTLTSVSKKTGVSVAVIREQNTIGKILKPGMKLKLPQDASSGKAVLQAQSSKKGTVHSAESRTGQQKESAVSLALNDFSKNKKRKTEMPSRMAAAEKKRPAAEKNQTRGVASAVGKTTTYSVQSGDTLWSIARKFRVPPMELLAWNGMNRETRLRPGDTVKIRQK
ncbi:MAG: transglycosylase SLT domain-containing protein [Desulfovibrionaceae bacterium]|nr:transglycosylase SLT domain-containing protein [Desulfovibrionaceae bacterium]